MDLLFSSRVDEIETMLNAELSGSKIIEAATINDTLTVPTGKSGEGFEDVFFNETACYYLRISASKLMQFKYIAAYQHAPILSVTHIAEIEKFV